MPEYLSPGVYVEETQAGNKPIEGVSTSTAGLVGVTERGPVNVPQLITSFPEYTRTFGGTLPIDEFTNAGRPHCYLPHSVEGFFLNGGKRTWITRVLPEEATFASRDMFFSDPAVANPGSTMLLRAAQQGSGTNVSPPLLYVLDVSNFAAAAPGDWVRIGDGSRSEYRQLTGAIGAQQRHVALSGPARNQHAAASPVRALPLADLAGVAAGTLTEAASAGDTQILVTNANPANILAIVTPPALVSWQVIEIGTAAFADYVFVRDAVQTAATEILLTLATPLRADYATGASVKFKEKTHASPPQEASTLSLPANVGDSLVFANPLPGVFATAGTLVIFEPDTDRQEAALIGALATLPLSVPAYSAYPAGSVGRRVTAADDDRNVTAANATFDVITLDDTHGLAPGMTLTFTDGAVTQGAMVSAVNETTNEVTLRNPLPWAPINAVLLQAMTLTADAQPGALSIALDNRLGLAVGDVIRINGAELGTIASFAGERGAAPDPGAVVLRQPLGALAPNGVTVRRQTLAVDPARHPVTILLPVSAGATQLLVNDGTAFAAADVIEITTPDGSIVYHALSGPFAAATPRELELDAPLDLSHTAGQPVIEREPLFEVRAIDAGAWGDRLLIATREETTSLASNTQVLTANPPAGPGTFSSLQLSSITGVEAGTILRMLNPDGSTIAGLPLLKVRRVERSSRLVTLDGPGLVAAHMTAVANAAMAGQRVRVRSIEFSLSVMLRQRPDPTTPARDEQLLDQEVFRWLSLDPRHSRYIERIIGVTYTPGSDTDDNGEPVRRSDRRSEGSSEYVRVHDLADPANREVIRLGPETLIDVLPSGLIRPARLPLSGGDDNVPGMDDAMYIGTDDTEPTRRTGLQSLRNPQTISLVAVPGQVSSVVQQSIIDQCEELRYRFAVLDGPAPQNDTVVDVQNQRQQFDTNYAALYHPWLTIPDPYPTSLAIRRQYPIPPAGHMLGIYARVDNDRGVHKAPANEVVRGITGLTRYFAKGEQDILNPYPVNINVIRDFRVNNRALRVWGARCITSLSEYKYVNVRRLLIFIEDSVDRGLQWVVFEPNAEPLWASVRRSVSNFLTTVWRNGALEGTTPEQAFFVKCDRTTMSADDRENGRLIVVCGIAPVKPAEFVIFRVGLWTADAEQ